MFYSLQFLHLESLFIKHWIADETNFPRLRHLSLCSCMYLEEIPSSFGEIPTLQQIDLIYSTKSIVASAQRILEEQSENGNDDLKLHITTQFWNKLPKGKHFCNLNILNAMWFQASMISNSISYLCIYFSSLSNVQV